MIIGLKLCSFGSQYMLPVPTLTPGTVTYLLTGWRNTPFTHRTTQQPVLLSKHLPHPREQVPLSSRREVCASRQREAEYSAHGFECLLDAEVLSKTISPLSLGSHARGFAGLLKREARRQSAKKNLWSSRSVIGNIFSNPGTNCLIIYGMWMSFSYEDFFCFNEKHILLKISWREKYFKNLLIV